MSGTSGMLATEAPVQRIPEIGGSVPDSQAHGGDGQSTSRLLHPGVEHERLRRIWEDNRRWVAAILLAYKPRWADLEDLLQEVASSMVAKSSELRDPGAIRPWLRQVAINAARLAGRKGKLRLTKSLEESGPAEPGTVVPPESPTQAAPSVLGREEECRRMNELLASLPDGYREPLYLKAVQSLSYRQIGHILGLPETTVETRIARARRMIRELSSQPQASAQAGLARSPEPTP